MVTCSKCGTQVLGDAAFCVKCGQRLKPTTPPASHIYCAKCGQVLPHVDGSPGTAETIQSVIPLNYAAPLSYLFGWVSGIVVYFMDKRPQVRFHAVQSIIVFGVLTIGGFISGRMSNRLFFESTQQISSIIAFVSFALICFTSLALWIVLMLKSFERKPFRVPIAASIAGLIAGKSAA
jgi:uncharacterized membrane protein|nr:zinc-ribbon domain-containing protein [Candidatus Acidoferrales bacterium]